MTMITRDDCPPIADPAPDDALDASMPGDATPELYAAVVHAADGVRFLAVRPTRAALTALLADYAGRSAPERLWADDAERVGWLLARGCLDAAVDEYFARVGERWDEECLYRGPTELMPARPAGAEGSR